MASVCRQLLPTNSIVSVHVFSLIIHYPYISGILDINNYNSYNDNSNNIHFQQTIISTYCNETDFLYFLSV